MNTLNKNVRSEVKSRVVFHYHLESAIRQMRQSFGVSCDPTISVVVGPHDVGMTTLCHLLRQKLNQEYESKLAGEPSFTPVIYLQLPFCEPGRFSWRDYWIHSLACGSSRTSPTSPHELMSALEQRVQSHGTVCYIMDEAEGFPLGAGTQQTTQVLDTLKYIACTCGLNPILAGSCDLLKILRQSDQLGRRIRRHHFQPYSLIRTQRAKLSIRAVTSAYVKPMRPEHPTAAGLSKTGFNIAGACPTKLYYRKCGYLQCLSVQSSACVGYSWVSAASPYRFIQSRKSACVVNARRNRL